MGKFLKMMSQADNNTLKSRANAINQQADIAQTNVINGLKQRKAEIEIQIQSLTDFAPDNTQSLRPGMANWNPSKWAKDLHNAKVELYELELQLKIAEETYKEFFGEEE